MKKITDDLGLTGFLKHYMAYACSITDAPIEFHLGAGLTLLATVAGSRITYPGFGGRVSWPILYTLLIAPSGLYRKSTSIGIAEDLLATVNPDLILSGEQSREKFLALLKEQPNVLYPISEFSSVLSMWNRDYSLGFKELVTDLFDCRQEYQRQTLKDGKVSIKRPAVNILAATTIDWLRDKLTEGDLRGGLMGRFVLIPGIFRGVDVGLVPDPDKSKRKELIDFLQSLSAIGKAWVDVRPMLAQYNSWVKAIEKKMSIYPNPELVGFQSRLGSHALKLAVLFLLSEWGALPKYELDKNNLERAEVMASWILERAEELASTGFIKSKIEQQIQKLLALANTNSGISRSAALKALHLSVRDFDTVVAAAIERCELRVFRAKTETKDKILYQLREAPPKPEAEI